MGFFDPRVERHLIADEGEVIIDEVKKHWAAAVKPMLELLLVIPLLALIQWLPASLYWIPLLGAPILALHALWRMLEVRFDRFVITNMRVFRVHGILSQHIATMPITRILDISVKKPVVGRIFGFGHFIFESAAQDQGLREIRYVGHPDQRGLTIQRVIQRSGIRGIAVRQAEAEAPPGSSSFDANDTSTQPVRVPAASYGRDTAPVPPVPPVPPAPRSAAREIPPASFHSNRVWPSRRRGDVHVEQDDPDGT